MSDVKFKPFYDYVLVEKKDISEKTTKSGIIIPTEVQSTQTFETGTVVRVGNGLKLQNGELRKLTVEVGDVVCYRKNTDFEIKLENGRKYYALSEGAIIGVFE